MDVTDTSNEFVSNGGGRNEINKCKSVKKKNRLKITKLKILIRPKNHDFSSTYKK